MKIYIDPDYKCHVSNDGSMREFDVPFFDGKCDTLIRGYRYLPPGESWERADGVLFTGEMIAPWQDYLGLYLAQLMYQLEQAREQLAAAEVAADA